MSLVFAKCKMLGKYNFYFIVIIIQYTISNIYYYFSCSELDLQYLLDAKKDKTKRLFFLKQEGESQRNKSITVTKGQTFRESFKVHLPASGIHDKLTSIDVQVRFLRSLKPVTI